MKRSLKQSWVLDNMRFSEDGRPQPYILVVDDDSFQMDDPARVWEMLAAAGYHVEYDELMDYGDWTE